MQLPLRFKNVWRANDIAANVVHLSIDALSLTNLSLHAFASVSLLHLFLSTNSTLVCLLSDIKSAVCFSYGYRYLGDGDTDRREILHDGTYRSRNGLLLFWGGAPSDLQNLKFWA